MPISSPTLGRMVIETGKGRKGRSFHADLLGWIDAPHHFEGGNTDTNAHRPIWMSFAASDQEARAFTINLLRGKRADVRGRHYHRPSDAKARFTLLKTAGYHHHTRRVGGGSVVCCYLPNLFRLNPGMVDPKTISFCLLTTREWRTQQKIDLPAAQALCDALDLTLWMPREYRKLVRPNAEELAELLPLAGLFLAYLDRRSRFPFPPDMRFGLQLLIRFLNEKFALKTGSRYGDGRRFNYEEHGFSNLGLPQGLAVQIKHEDFSTILSEETQKWHALSQ